MFIDHEYILHPELVDLWVFEAKLGHKAFLGLLLSLPFLAFCFFDCTNDDLASNIHKSTNPDYIWNHASVEE